MTTRIPVSQRRVQTTGTMKLGRYTKVINRSSKINRVQSNTRCKEIRYKDLYSLYKRPNADSSLSVKQRHRQKNWSIEKSELAQTNRSRSEGSTRREKESKRLQVAASENMQGKITIRDNYEARRKDLVTKPSNLKSAAENQMIYTFRENNEATEGSEENGK